MTSVIFTGSPGETQGDSGGRGHFILAELPLQAMLGASYLTLSCSELPRARPYPSKTTGDLRETRETLCKGGGARLCF